MPYKSNKPEIHPNKMYQYLRLQLSPSPFTERKTAVDDASFEHMLVKAMTKSNADSPEWQREGARYLSALRANADAIHSGISAAGIPVTGFPADGISAHGMDAYRAVYGAADRVSRVNRHAMDPSAYDGIIRAAAERFGVREQLIRAVIATESSFRADAVSPAGAKGLMQLMDRTAASLGVTDPFDPVQNIMGGTRYLAQMLERFDGSEKLALAAYNAGPGRLEQLGIRNESDLFRHYDRLPLETQRYIPKVLGRIL